MKVEESQMDEDQHESQLQDQDQEDIESPSNSKVDVNALRHSSANNSPSDRASKKLSDKNLSQSNSKHKSATQSSKTDVDPRDISRDVIQKSNSNHRPLNASPSVSQRTQSADKENHHHRQQSNDGDFVMQDQDRGHQDDAEPINRSKASSPPNHVNTQDSNGRSNGVQRSNSGPTTSSSMPAPAQRRLQSRSQSLLDEDDQLDGIGGGGGGGDYDLNNFQSRAVVWGQDDYRNGNLVAYADEKPVFRMNSFGMSHDLQLRKFQKGHEKQMGNREEI